MICSQPLPWCASKSTIATRALQVSFSPLENAVFVRIPSPLVSFFLPTACTPSVLVPSSFASFPSPYLFHPSSPSSHRSLPIAPPRPAPPRPAPPRPAACSSGCARHARVLPGRERRADLYTSRAYFAPTRMLFTRQNPLPAPTHRRHKLLFSASPLWQCRRRLPNRNEPRHRHRQRHRRLQRQRQRHRHWMGQRQGRGWACILRHVLALVDGAERVRGARVVPGRADHAECIGKPPRPDEVNRSQHDPRRTAHSMQHATHRTQRTACTACNAPHAACNTHHATCSTQHARFDPGRSRRAPVRRACAPREKGL